jgi:hypothetical protein
MNAATLEKRFSPERLGLLVRNRVLDDAPVFGIAAAGVFALKLLGLFIGAHAGRNVGSHETWPTLIAAGGILLASRAFERMHDGRGGSEWVLLPATPAEKYVGAFLSYLVLYPVVAVAASVALSALLALIGTLLGAPGPGIWLPIRLLDAGPAASYALFAAFALAGSASFRKFALVKTAALSIAWMSLLGLIWFGLAFLFAGGHLTLREIDLPESKRIALEILSGISKTAAFVGAALYGYFRVAEKESVDEVQ